ncbi:hypothetical protein BJX64DRAFT_247809 [Aspergillus heterothallicus]
MTPLIHWRETRSLHGFIENMIVTKYSSFQALLSLDYCPLWRRRRESQLPFSVSSAKLGWSGLQSGLVLLDLSSHWSRTKTRLLESRSSLQPILARFSVLTLTLPRSRDSGPLGLPVNPRRRLQNLLAFPSSCFMMLFLIILSFLSRPFLLIPGDLIVSSRGCLMIDSFPRQIPLTRL